MQTYNTGWSRSIRSRTLIRWTLLSDLDPVTIWIQSYRRVVPEGDILLKLIASLGQCLVGSLHIWYRDGNM
jgi:hypothetical protein